MRKLVLTSAASIGFKYIAYMSIIILKITESIFVFNSLDPVGETYNFISSEIHK